jgi:ribonuclease BN (tRNA processing enzyme)
MRVTFVGSGDAFGSGGRFNTCFHVEASCTKFLIDCGATSLVAMKRQNIDRNAIDTILITHFHGDHFGGIPYFILDAQFLSNRTRPLTIVGPDGLPKWYEKVMEVTFPGSSRTKQKFNLELRELPVGKTQLASGLEIQAALVRHGQPEGPFFSYRVQVENKIIAYTGDTEWCDALIEIGQEADLFIAEAYFFDKKVPLHLDLATIDEKLPLIRPKRLILTHMSSDVLSRIEKLKYETAADGMRIEI